MAGDPGNLIPRVRETARLLRGHPPMPLRTILSAMAAIVCVTAASSASAQCTLTGNAEAVATLGDRQILAGNTEVIVNSANDVPGADYGFAPKGSESSRSVPGGRRVAGGRDTLRYVNRNVPAGQALELHIVGAAIAPPRTVVGGSKKPIVLVVVSNGENARWKLVVSPGTTLAKVVLQGSKAEIEGVPAGVEVVRRAACEQHMTGRGVRRQGADIEYSPVRIQRVLADIRAFTGLVETTFQHGFAPESFVASASQETALPALEPMSAEQIAKATDVRMLEYFGAVRARLPEAARPAATLLIDLVSHGRMPAATFTENGERLPLLWFPPDTPVMGARPACSSNVLVGQGASRAITCAGEPRLYFTEGPGRSMIRDGGGSSLFATGRGTSFISAGSGRDLIVLERGWGIASVSKTCGIATSRLRGRRPPMGMIHTGFLLFGQGVRSDDLAWYPAMRRTSVLGEIGGVTQAARLAALRSPPSRVLLNRKSRDILILRQTCFNFVFLEEGRISLPIVRR